MPGFEKSTFNANEALQGAEEARIERNKSNKKKEKEDLDEKLTALLLEKYWLDIEIEELEKKSQKVNAIGKSLEELKDKQAELKSEIKKIRELLKQF